MELLWNAVLTAITLLLGWVFTMMQKRLDDMDARHSKAVESAMASMVRVTEAQTNAHLKMQDAVTNIQINYVHKNDLKEMRTELNDRFDRLESLMSTRNRE
jgi:uncharacterized membrane protein YvbJ